MKTLYRRLGLTFALFTLVIAVLFALSLYERRVGENNRVLNQLLDSAQQNYESALADQEERLELLKEDYLNRAWTVEYILSGDYQAISDGAGMEVLRELMEVKNIAVLDAEGKVLLSATGETALPPGNRSDQMAALETENALVCVDTPDFTRRPSYFYVLVRSRDPRFAAVLVEAETARLDLRSQKELMRDTLLQATTEYETGLVAVDCTSGKVLGTAQDTQRFQIRGREDPDALLHYLAGAAEEASLFLTIDGRACQAVMHRQQNVYLVAFSEMDQLFGSMARTFLEGLLGIGALSILTMLLFHYHISRMERELSRARTEARFDKLTGLYNRSGFEQRVEAFLAQDSPAGVLLLFDLDNFKRINDAEGHPEGDRVLKRFAGCLNTGFRKSDCLGRLGGDEFVVLIPNPVPEPILRQKLDAVLQDVRRMLGSYCEKYGASVSAGAVPVDGSIKSYAGLYQCADAALYIAKYRGKGQYYINTAKLTCAKQECSHCGRLCNRRSCGEGEP